MTVEEQNQEERILIKRGGCDDIVGILHRTLSGPGGSLVDQKPLALIIPGVLAHKNQSYHELLANRLADERGLDSFRYDLRGQGGESEGNWGLANFGDDADDLGDVIEYLKTALNYRVHLIVGHSRGSMMSGFFLSTRKHDFVPLWVNVSGRYDMTQVLRKNRYDHDFVNGGHYDWKVKVAGKKTNRQITSDGLQSFADWNNAYLISSFPQATHVLTVHGDADETVPVEDAYSYEKILSQRNPGTHSISIVKGASHNWSRPGHEPVNSIMTWLDRVDPLTKPKSYKL